MMKHRLCSVGICLLMVRVVVAGGPPQNAEHSSVSAATSATASPVTERKQIKALLQRPARLDFGQRTR